MCLPPPKSHLESVHPLTSKTEKTRGDQDDSYGGRGIPQNGKMTHGHGQQCGDYGGEGAIRRLNGNGKTQ